MVRVCIDLTEAEFSRFCDAVKAKHGDKIGNRSKFAYNAVIKSINEVEKEKVV
jgi:hypothetical protein